MEEFFINIIYKNKKVKFRVMNPESTLDMLMQNLKHATGKDGRLIFDFPSVDPSGAPLDYFFGKNDTDINEVRVLRPRIGKTDKTLLDYGIASGDNVYLIADPFPG